MLDKEFCVLRDWGLTVLKSWSGKASRIRCDMSKKKRKRKEVA